MLLGKLRQKGGLGAELKVIQVVFSTGGGPAGTRPRLCLAPVVIGSSGIALQGHGGCWGEQPCTTHRAQITVR